MTNKDRNLTADYLPFEDYKRLVANLIEEEKYWWATYCVLAFCTGLRFSDLSRIRWKDILGERRIIIKAKKTGKTHTIPIGTSASERLEELYIKLGKPNKNTLVIGSKDSEGLMPVSIQYVDRELKRFVRKYDLNIGNFSSHTFRKTFGRYVYESNGKTEESLIFLNTIFRHTSLDTTRIYIGLRNDEIKNIYQGIVI